MGAWRGGCPSAVCLPTYSQSAMPKLQRGMAGERELEPDTINDCNHMSIHPSIYRVGQGRRFFFSKGRGAGGPVGSLSSHNSCSCTFPMTAQ